MRPKEMFYVKKEMFIWVTTIRTFVTIDTVDLFLPWNKAIVVPPKYPLMKLSMSPSVEPLRHIERIFLSLTRVYYLL